MSDDKKLTACCGLYCSDCIPSQRELFTEVARLEELLEKLHFDKYAQAKAEQTYWSKANEVFKKYKDFIEVLQGIRQLECKVNCREGGGWKGASCNVRNCVLAKNLEGCWDCDNYKTCESLDPLKKFHPNLEYHLSLIKSEGIENWSGKRKSHYHWI